MSQPHNESTRKLLMMIDQAIEDSIEHLDHVRNAAGSLGHREQLYVTLQFAQLYATAIRQHLDQIENTSALAVRDNSTIEELHHRISDLLNQPRTRTP